MTVSSRPAVKMSLRSKASLCWGHILYITDLRAPPDGVDDSGAVNPEGLVVVKSPYNS